MLAYVLYSKDLGLVMKALDALRDENLKFDVDLDKGNIYVNEAEASRPCRHCDKLLESLIVPRKCFLRTVSMGIDQDGNISYGSDGSGVSTGTQGLLERIRNTTNVEIMRGLIYYTQRNAFWITGEGYFSVDRFKEDLSSGKKYSQKVLRYWDILKKLVTL
jgi:hypothetical protein